MFDTVLIANRGEIALRVLRACRGLGLKTVAVFSEADRDAPYLRVADQALCIGPAAPAQSYLNQAAILAAALAGGAQAFGQDADAGGIHAVVVADQYLQKRFRKGGSGAGP